MRSEELCEAQGRDSPAGSLSLVSVTTVSQYSRAWAEVTCGHPVIQPLESPAVVAFPELLVGTGSCFNSSGMTWS